MVRDVRSSSYAPTSFSTPYTVDPEPYIDADALDTYRPSSGYNAAAPEAATMQRTGVTPQSPLREAVALAQSAPRLNQKGHTAEGAALGMASGGVLGVIITIATLGFGAPSIPVLMAAGAGAGAGTGAKRNRRLPTGSFGHVRQHLFSQAGIVSSRRDSESLIKKLKSAGVLSHGRDRAIRDLTLLDVLPPERLGIDAYQLEHVKQALTQIDQETDLYDGLVSERMYLNQAALKMGAGPNLTVVRDRLSYLENAINSFPYRLPTDAYADDGHRRAARAAGI